MSGKGLHRVPPDRPHLVKGQATKHVPVSEHTVGYWREARTLTVVVTREMLRTRALTIAAALAFYFLLSLIPLLVVFSSVLKFLPVPNLFQQLLNLMATLVPPYAMAFVEQIVVQILKPGRVQLLSFGLLGYLWTASGGFTSLIEALDIAYDVPVSRPWLRERLRALLLALTSGGLLAISLIAYIAGPHFGHFVQGYLSLPPVLANLWPVVRLVITFLTFVAALELIYYLGPNVRHSFLETLPGAVLAIVVWFVSSWALSFYLDNISNYNRTYGSMGAMIGLMVWFYLTGLAILLGAELNGERVKYRARYRHQGPVTRDDG
ncbi:MAG: YihY/virulence factor BrkB family protein [Acidobacteriaceae bacterium]